MRPSPVSSVVPRRARGSRRRLEGPRRSPAVFAADAPARCLRNGAAYTKAPTVKPGYFCTGFWKNEILGMSMYCPDLSRLPCLLLKYIVVNKGFIAYLLYSVRSVLSIIKCPYTRRWYSRERG